MILIAELKEITRSNNFKHGIFYAMFSFINSGISFALVLILAKFLIAAEYGRLSLFNTFVIFLNLIITLSSASYIAVSFFQRDRKTFQKIIIVVITITTGMLIFFSSLFAIFPTFIQNIIGVDIKYLWLGLLIGYFTVFNNINLDIWRLEEKPIYYGIYNMSFAVLNFILTFWLIVGEYMGWEGRVYVWFILGVLYFIISLIFLNRRQYLVITIPTKNLFKETLLFALPLFPHSVSFWLKQGVDRYIINYYYEASVVGYFSFAMNLAAIITIIGSAYNATYSVYLFKKLSAGYLKAKSQLDRQSRYMTFFFSLISILIILGAYWLIICFMIQYQESLKFIVPLCIGGLFQCIYYIWVSYIIYYKHTVKLMTITVGTTILQIMLSVFFTRYSPIYAAWTSMSMMIVTVLLVYCTSHRIIKTDAMNQPQHI